MLAIIYCSVGRTENEKRLNDNVQKTMSDYAIYKKEDEIDLPTVERYNNLYKSLNTSAEYVMFGADDITFEDNFDKKVNKIFSDMPHIDILYPNDGIQGESLATHPIFRKSFLDKTGEFFPSGYMRHSYIDNYILDLGKALKNIHYDETLKIFHHHPIAKKGRWDKYYLKVYDRKYMLEDFNQYQRCIKEHLPEIIQRVKN